jgi:hypothetical protein
MGVQFKVFKGAPPETTIKTYADLASKIWGAFLALYIVILTQRYKAVEPASKPNQAGAPVPTSSQSVY